VHTEGRVTERQYLKIAKSHGVKVDFGEAGKSPSVLVKHAERDTENQRGRFDEIWCIFDYDRHLDVVRAIQQAKQAGVRIALSNPCFELWLVLHAEEQNAEIEQRRIQQRCQELGLTDGKAIAGKAKEQLKAGYEAARRRAQALEKMHHESGRLKTSNPSSNVWQLTDQCGGFGLSEQSAKKAIRA